MALANNLGMAPEQARRMKYVDYLRLARGWQDHPPPSAMLELIARLNGWKPKPAQSELEGDLAASISEINERDDATGVELYGGDLSRFLTPEFAAKGAAVKNG